jgi:hypothetical protein
MPVEKEYMDILQNIEYAIHTIHLDKAALTDYEVDRALEAVVKPYQKEASGQSPILPGNPNSAQVYQAVRSACEVRLGRAPIPKTLKQLGNGQIQPVSVEVILLCLKRIRKSIATWTRQSGRQGYLYFISQFMP